MASGGKSKATASGGGAEKRRRVAFPTDVDPFSCNANECLKLHIVLTGEELQAEDGDYTFEPEFSERIFGEDGKIHGYKDLKVCLNAVNPHGVTFVNSESVRFLISNRSISEAKSNQNWKCTLKFTFSRYPPVGRDAISEETSRVVVVFAIGLVSKKYADAFMGVSLDDPLQIDLWLHAATLHAYVEIVYTSKSTGGKKSSCTDVRAKLKEAFGDGLTEDRYSFQQSLLTYSHEFQQLIEKHGEVVCSWGLEAGFSPSFKKEYTNADRNSESPDKLKQIVRLELGVPATRAWHEHLTPLSLLFIEGASPIESDDPLWEVYIAVEGEGHQLRVAGFCNVYRFYHYPDSSRLRISQILVLPPYQGDGFGLHLLKAVNAAAIERSCYDVTMEEPSVVLQKLRDTMDVLRLLSLSSLDEAVKVAVEKLQAKKESVLSRMGSEVTDDQGGPLVSFNGSKIVAPCQMSRPGSKEKSLLVPPANLVEEIRRKLKMCKMQFKRCWEQLLFMYLDPKDTDLQDVFQGALVERLNFEVFEKDGGRKSGDKRIVDTDNEYDNSKTFVMMRSRNNDLADENGCNGDKESRVTGDEVSALAPGPEEKGKVLQEELKEREEELVGVGRTVSRHFGNLGLSFPSMKIWEQVAPEPSGQAT